LIAWTAALKPGLNVLIKLRQVSMRVGSQAGYRLVGMLLPSQFQEGC